MIQDHSFKHQLIRDILTAIGTIVIFVWIIFSYKLYKWVYLINILAAAVWKFWQVWFNFGCFQHISALKSIKYPRNPLKESQHYQNNTQCHLLYSTPTLVAINQLQYEQFTKQSLFWFRCKWRTKWNTSAGTGVELT